MLEILRLLKELKFRKPKKKSLFEALLRKLKIKISSILIIVLLLISMTVVDPEEELLIPVMFILKIIRLDIDASVRKHPL